MKIVSLEQKRIFSSDIILSGIFTFLMVLSAIRIPLFFTPVPVTLQTFIVCLSIVFLKGKAFLPQSFYLLLGACGLPVFAGGGSGFLYFWGPTGGYLLGFLAAAIISPYFLPRQATFMKMFFVFTFANAIIYLSGLLWLVAAYHFSLPAAAAAGLLPFIAPELLKILAASAIAAGVTKPRA